VVKHKCAIKEARAEVSSHSSEGLMSRSVKPATQSAAWEAIQENNRKIRETRDRIQAWATATAGPSSEQEGTSQGPDPDDEEPSLDDQDDGFVPSEWSDLLAVWAREPGPNDDVTDKVTAD
jgi:hypothetical protein